MCQIPLSHAKNEIQWLEIHEEDGGFYLYQLIDENSPLKWDTFYQNIDELLSDCLAVWGVSDNMWQQSNSANSSQHRGSV